MEGQRKEGKLTGSICQVAVSSGMPAARHLGLLVSVEAPPQNLDHVEAWFS